MVLGAGLGTRLRPLTELRPKPVVPVGGRPLAWFTLDCLRRAGVRDVVMNTHYLADVLRTELDPWIPAGMTVTYLHEPELLGTGGGLRNAWERLTGDGDEPVLVMNADILFCPDLAHLTRVHRQSGAVATMVLRRVDDPHRYGAVEIDGGGRVRRLLGEPRDAGAELRALMFTGVHCLSARAGADLPETGCIIRRSYRHWVDTGQVVMGVVEDAEFRDLGTVEAYRQANEDLAAGRLVWPGLGDGG